MWPESLAPPPLPYTTTTRSFVAYMYITTVRNIRYRIYRISTTRIDMTVSRQFGLTTHTHTHPFNGPFSGTTQVGRYQKGKTNLNFTEARDSEW